MFDDSFMFWRYGTIKTHILHRFQAIKAHDPRRGLREQSEDLHLTLLRFFDVQAPLVARSSEKLISAEASWQRALPHSFKFRASRSP